VTAAAPQWQPPPSLPRPPPPAAGSPRYFALLYSPAAARAALMTLLALADEIGAGAGRGLDHSVAHVRLDWWRSEAERYQRRQPQHPWLRALLAPQQAQQLQRPQRAAAGPLDLQPLVDAAAIDLATATLGVQPPGAADSLSVAGASLPGAVFGQLERVLRPAPEPAPPPQLQRAVCDLGRLAGELERLTGGAETASVLDALRLQVAAIDGALQPRLAPLLVWVALIARRAHRQLQRGGAHNVPALDALADNIVAWNAARRAARGRFRID